MIPILILQARDLGVPDCIQMPLPHPPDVPNVQFRAPPSLQMPDGLPGFKSPPRTLKSAAQGLVPASRDTPVILILGRKPDLSRLSRQLDGPQGHLRLSRGTNGRGRSWMSLSPLDLHKCPTAGGLAAPARSTRLLLMPSTREFRRSLRRGPKVPLPLRRHAEKTQAW